MAKLKIKKGDNVVVLSGSHKGKTGTVVRVFPGKAKAIVEGVNIAKKTCKAKRTKSARRNNRERSSFIYL